MRKCIKNEERKEEEDQHLEIRTALLSLKTFLLIQSFEKWLLKVTPSFEGICMLVFRRTEFINLNSVNLRKPDSSFFAYFQSVFPFFSNGSLRGKKPMM